jgi:hypothetical protein
MPVEFSELLFFQRCAGLNGKAREVQIARRNGLPVPLLDPSWTSPEMSPDTDEAEQIELREELCYGLSPKEKDTWLQIINGQSIPAIAAAEKVTHPAIYCRIRGHRRTKGMIHKNAYVARWWELRKRRWKTLGRCGDDPAPAGVERPKPFSAHTP